jgi:hypothetical protein
LLSPVEITDSLVRGNSTLGDKPVLNKPDIRKQIFGTEVFADMAV